MLSAVKSLQWWRFVHASARTGPGRLLLATLLKTRRDLGYFPAPNAVHAGTVAHLAAQLSVTQAAAWPDEVRLTKSLCRYQAAVRTHLSVTAYGTTAEPGTKALVWGAPTFIGRRIFIVQDGKAVPGVDGAVGPLHALR